MIRVYKYDISKEWAASCPLLVLRQFHLARLMANDLVTLELDYDKSITDMWNGRPEILQVEQVICDLQNQIESTLSADSENKDLIKSLKAELKEKRSTRRRLKAEAFEELKEEIRELRDSRYASITSIRTKYGQKGHGLYWGTQQLVLRNHEVAVSLVKRSRKSGKGAQLRYRGFDGSGSMSGQIMHQAGRPPRTPRMLSSPNDYWWSTFRLPLISTYKPAQFRMLSQERRRVEVTVSLGSMPGTKRQNLLRIPITMHRPIPLDSEILLWQINRYQVGRTWYANLTMTVRLPDPAPTRNTGGAMAIHLGWRSMADGGIRVGTIATSDPIPVPERLARYGIIRSHGDKWHEIVIPKEWRDKLEHSSSIVGQRDEISNTARKMLTDWLREHPEAWQEASERAQLTVEERFDRWMESPCPISYPDRRLNPDLVEKWNSTKRLESLVEHWIINTPPGAEYLIHGTEAWSLERRHEMHCLSWWLKQSIHLGEWAAHERHKLIGRRNDAYRCVAAWLTDHVSTAVIDNIDLMKMRDLSFSDDPRIVKVSIRSLMMLAAPGVLRDSLSGATARKGIPVVLADTSDMSRTHVKCGHISTDKTKFAKSHIVACEGCGTRFDQDHNAALWLLREAARKP